MFLIIQALETRSLKKTVRNLKRAKAIIKEEKGEQAAKEIDNFFGKVRSSKDRKEKSEIIKQGFKKSISILNAGKENGEEKKKNLGNKRRTLAVNRVSTG